MDSVNGSRLQQFCQFKSEIRGSTEYLVVGLDIAKEKHNAFFGTATGRTLHRGMFFDNTLEGFHRLLTQVEALKTQYGLSKVVFGMEPTANYHKPLAEHLIERGHMVVLVSPVSAAKNRELLDGRWDKHDTKDAANVADLIAQGKCLYYDYPEAAIRDIRSLLSFKKRLKKEEQALQVRIRNQLLAQYFPEMDRHFRSAVSLAVIRYCLDPSIIAGMEYDEFCRTVAPGRVNFRQQRLLQQIWELAHQSIGCRVGETVLFEAQTMISSLHRVRETIKAVDDKIEELCLPFSEYSFLLTIPGFGPEVSSTVLSAIGNPYRFSCGKQVLKMAGFDLCADRSGKTASHAVPVISKRGKVGLRCALYQAALVASNSNTYFMTYYTKKLKNRAQEQGIGTKMRVKLAAKLLIVAWTLMKKKEVFDPAYLEMGDTEV
ncbi:MAG TPA: IS110 family transposase [Nitrospirota bacterium]|nr:IS110 family transposase [Nitrospirota bacterium]